MRMKSTSSRCLVAASSIVSSRHQSFVYGWSLRAPTGVDLAMERIEQHPDFVAFQQGRQSFCVLDQAIDADATREIRRDAVLLQKSGFGGPAGIQSGRNTDVRKNVHQIWLRHSGSADECSVLLGNVPGRELLYRFMNILRSELECGTDLVTRILPHQLSELSYISYTPGAFYRQHIDCIAGADREYQRSVSLLLYLGDPNDEDARKWDPDRDGGSLRIQCSGQDDDDSNGRSRPSSHAILDVTPHPGTLVLFDSANVSHEVLETHRSRLCVAGWFSAPIVTKQTQGE